MDVLDVVSGRVADNAAAFVEERRQRNAAAAKRGAGSELDEHLAALEGLMSELKKDARLNARLKDKQQKARVKSAMTPEDTPGRVKYARKNLGKKYKGVKDLKRILELLKDAKVETGPVQTERRHPAARRRYEAIEKGLMEISEAAVKKRAEANDAKEARDQKQKERKDEQNRIADQFFSHRSNILVGLYIANKKEDHEMVDVLINKLLYESGINVSENIEVGYTPGNLYSLKADVARANKEFAVVKYTFNQFVKLHRKLSGKKSADVDPRTAEGIKFLDRIRGKWEALDSHEKREKEINKLITNLKSGVVYEHRVLFGRHRRSRRHRK